MNIRLNASDHASKGMITATQRGVILWRGAGKDIAEGIKLGADTLHVHSGDAPLIQKVFEKAGHSVMVLK